MVLTLAAVNKQEANFWCLLPFIIMGSADISSLYVLVGNSARLMLHKGIKTQERSPISHLVNTTSL